ncbi:MAG: 30S ribosomal protein S4 [Parcubacteria group bacterium CG10_big_fil_rev_8_21_14_0_10_38_31]|nr:MAG: 30S ribosomal protein S4 [Parcubacteria group bacterium CG10_big_fil_rev_8_21_14_0_10_38_31]
MENSQCKICRRAGAKLFLKGERCITPKCAMVTKPYTPGALGKSGGKRKGRRGSSEYGTQLRDKQVVKFSYGLRERQFVNYVKEASKKKGVASLELVKLLESRLDNVVYRLGFTSNRASSRQLVSHGHITINGRRNNIPSYRVKTGDLIGIRGGSVGKGPFEGLADRWQKFESPTWLTLDKEKKEAIVTGDAVSDDTRFNFNSIIELYSR